MLLLLTISSLLISAISRSSIWKANEPLVVLSFLFNMIPSFNDSYRDLFGGCSQIPASNFIHCGEYVLQKLLRWVVVNSKSISKTRFCLLTPSCYVNARNALRCHAIGTTWTHLMVIWSPVRAIWNLILDYVSVEQRKLLFLRGVNCLAGNSMRGVKVIES